MVEAIIPVLRTVEMDKLIEQGIPVLGVLLKDENQSIRIGIMQKIMDINEMVDKEDIVKSVIPLV